MEIKEISYQNRVPKNMISKFNYFVKDFLKEYSNQLDEMEAGKSMTVNKEYEGDLDVYFEDLEYKTSKILGHISIIHENIDSIGEIFNTLTNMMTNKNIGILTVLTVII